MNFEETELSLPSCKAHLPPRLIGSQRYGVGKINAPVSRLHRHTHQKPGLDGVSQVFGQAPRFRTEHQEIPGTIPGLGVKGCAAGAEREKTLRPDLFDKSRVVRMFADPDKLVIIQTRPPKCLLSQLETQRVDQM